MHNYKPALVIAAAAALVLMAPAAAEQRLREYDAAPFSLAVHHWMPVEVLDHTSQAGYRLAPALPASMVSMVVLRLRWPRSDQECHLGVAQLGEVMGYQQQQPSCALAVVVGEGEPRRVLLPANPGGPLNRLCIWPTGRSSDAELVFLMTTAEPVASTSVYGFSLNAQGEVRMLDTGGALTLYGWFDAVDLDEDGSFELLTSRNLDGTWGGFFYHTVRGYEPGAGRYVASPDDYQDYFRTELAWLDWVVATRELIQQNPEPYLSNSGIGYIYVAEYQGRSYGFDTIIELPATAAGVENLQQYNSDRRAAFRLVFTYRDELADWLDGGPYPATWKLAP